MEFRREKSAKSKELIKIHSKSNIFNIDTEYYKKEKIYPISRKPNEIGKKLIEFTPKYKELKHYERKYENLLSDQQRRSTNLLSLKPNKSTKHFDLEKQRNRNREIEGYCCDKKGNLSSRKLYILDTYGTRNIINNSVKKYFFSYEDNYNNESNLNYNNNYKHNKSIKEKRKLLKNKNKNLKNKYLNNLSISRSNLYNKKYNDNYNENNKKNNNIESDLDEINNLMNKLSTKEKNDTLDYIRNIIYNKNKDLNQNKINKNKNINSTREISEYTKNSQLRKKKENDKIEKRFKNTENDINKIRSIIKKPNNKLPKRKRKGTPGTSLRIQNNEIE